MQLCQGGVVSQSAPGVTLPGAVPGCLLPSAFAAKNHVLLQASMELVNL